MRDVTEQLDEGAPELGFVPLRLASVEDYRLGRELARGGMGQILEADDLRHGRRVALKRPLGAGDAAVHRFVREARMAARLEHPGIVPVYEAGLLPSGEPFLAMKQVAGKSLHETVRATTRLAERLALLPRLIAVADALAYAHGRGVVHRDLTPSNVLLGAHGETVIIDWGVATDDATPAPGSVGTPRFIAPEQARGDAVDPRADVYSLGAVLHFTLAGGPPGAAELDPSLPADLRAIVARAMAADPAARYPTAAELADDLGRFVTGGLVRAHVYSPAARLRRWARRRRGALVAALLALVALVGIGAASFVRIARERDTAIAARERARATSERAAHLVAFLVEDLHPKLVGIGRERALAGLGAQVRRFYASVRAAPTAPLDILDAIDGKP